ncbi:MAG: carboxypeptidase-like regulatory domain-containing protein [Paludibaculum sp.]
MNRLVWCLAAITLTAGAQQNPFFGATAPQPEAKPTGSIRGQVVDSSTGEPVREAQVMIQGRGPVPSMRTVIADEAGQFTATELPAGPYYLQAAHQSHPGPFGLPQTGIFTEILPARETKGITVSLLAPAVITGRVLDDGGEPLANCNLVLLQAPLGRMPGQSTAFAQSNDRGEFRMAPVAPDRYLLQAKCMEELPVENLLSVVGPEGFDPRESWQTAYYPIGSAEGAGASFGLSAGAEMKVEIHMQPVAVSTISGVVNAAPGVSWKNPPMLQLAGRDGAEGGRQPDAVAVVQPNNTFRFTMVQPGNYRLFGTTQDGGPEMSNVADMQLSIGAAPPPPLTVQFRPSMVIQGKVDDPHGEAAPPAGPIGMNIITDARGPKAVPMAPVKGSVMLLPAGSNLPFGPKMGQVNAQDGTFQIGGVTPGRWRVRYQSFQGPAWVEAVRYGDAPVENQQIEVADGASGALSLTLGAKPPAVKYELKDASPSSTVKSYWIIQALPVQRDGPGNQAFVGSGSPGQPVTGQSLAPGRYYFFGFEQSVGGQMVNERELELLSRQIEPAEITPGSEQTIVVRCFSMAEIEKTVANFIAGEDR